MWWCGLISTVMKCDQKARAVESAQIRTHRAAPSKSPNPEVSGGGDWRSSVSRDVTSYRPIS